MAPTCRRPMNRLMKEIDQGIQEYDVQAKELVAHRRYGDLIGLLAGENPRGHEASRQIRPDGRPIVWS